MMPQGDTDLTHGYRIKRLSIHKAIRMRGTAANRNPIPRYTFERRMVELKKQMAALTDMAHKAGLLEG